MRNNNKSKANENVDSWLANMTEANRKVLAMRMYRVIAFSRDAREIAEGNVTITPEGIKFPHVEELTQPAEVHNITNSFSTEEPAAVRIRNLKQTIEIYINESHYMPADMKQKFITALNVRNEKEFYRNAAFVVGAAVVFTLTPICFVLAYQGQALCASALAMLAMAVALIPPTYVEKRIPNTYFFDAKNGPQYNAKEFQSWFDSLDDLVTQSIPVIKTLPKPSMV